MFDAFMFGLVDELEKQAGIRTTLKKGLAAARKIPGKVREGAKRIEESAKETAASEPTGGVPNQVTKLVQKKIRGMKEGPLKKGLRRGAHEVRKAVHERKATLDPETAAKARKAGAKVVEQGAHAPKPVRTALKWGVSSAHPLTRKVVIGGRTKDAPDVAKHEVGHLSGFSTKSPAASTAANIASRKVGPAAAAGLAALGKKRSAKAVGALSDAATLAEEGRAWAHGKGRDLVRSAKKGDIKGVAKQLKDPAIGMGSYAVAAKKRQKMLSQMADKANRRKLLKKFPKAKAKP